MDNIKLWWNTKWSDYLRYYPINSSIILSLIFIIMCVIIIHRYRTARGKVPKSLYLASVSGLVTGILYFTTSTIFILHSKFKILPKVNIYASVPLCTKYGKSILYLYTLSLGTWAATTKDSVIQTYGVMLFVASVIWSWVDLKWDLMFTSKTPTHATSETINLESLMDTAIQRQFAETKSTMYYLGIRTKNSELPNEMKFKGIVQQNQQESVFKDFLRLEYIIKLPKENSKLYDGIKQDIVSRLRAGGLNETPAPGEINDTSIIQFEK